MSTFTPQELLSKEQVTFCVDTNILIEFQALDALGWSELAPAATEIRIIVPTTVGKEMDAHKKSSGRLRKRASEFSSLVAQLEGNNYDPLVLREDAPKVTLEFGYLYRTSELDAELFDLTDADQRIVAEAHQTAMGIPSLVFLSDDGLPLRLAHQAGLPALRPPTTWRRPEGLDGRDQEIADLKRQLGPQPDFVLAFPDASTTDRRHALGVPPVIICPYCVNRVVPLSWVPIPNHHDVCSNIATQVAFGRCSTSLDLPRLGRSLRRC